MANLFIQISQTIDIQACKYIRPFIMTLFHISDAFSFLLYQLDENLPGISTKSFKFITSIFSQNSFLDIAPFLMNSITKWRFYFHLMIFFSRTAHLTGKETRERIPDFRKEDRVVERPKHLEAEKKRQRNGSKEINMQ